jgi:hypothetical protein
MVNNDKWIWFGILALSLVLIIAPYQAEAKTDPPIPRNKVVVLVYDDSGSMWKQNDQNGQEIPIDNWKYANYALQSFMAMMDSEDVLKIVKMSEPKTAVQVELLKDRRQPAIDRMRAWQGKSSTPLSSMYTSIAELEAAAEANTHSDFWLIVLTDGIFTELNNLDGNSTEEQIETRKKDLFGQLETLKKKMEENEAPFHTALIPIEIYLKPEEKTMMSDFKQNWKNSTNGNVLESKGQLDIIDRINEVAALMTNRDPSAADLYQLNPVFKENQLILQSPFPLRRISIIEQSTEAGATFSMKEFHINDRPINKGIDGPFKIETPEDPLQLNPLIKGSLTHFKNETKDSIIESGSYKIVFEQSLTDEQKRNMQILAEPALDFTVSFKKINDNGSVTKDTSTFFAGSNMQIETRLTKNGSNQEPINLRNGDIDSRFEVVAQVEQQKVTLTYDKKENLFKGKFVLIEKENIPVKVSMNIKGFYLKEKELILHGYPIRKLKLKSESKGWTAKLGNFEKATPYIITPMFDGKEISTKELKEIFSNLKITFTQHDLKFDVKQVGNKIQLLPQESWPLFRTPVGEIPFTLALKGKYPKEFAESTFNLKINDLSWTKKFGPLILWSFVFLVLAVYIFGIIRKPRFAYQHISVEFRRGRRRERMKEKRGTTEHFHGNWVNRWLVPFIPEKKTIVDVTFKAHSNKDRVLLVKECQEENMIVRHEKLLERSNKEDILLFNNDEIKIERGNYTYTYVFKSTR